LIIGTCITQADSSAWHQERNCNGVSSTDAMAFDALCNVWNSVIGISAGFVAKNVYV